MMRWGEVTHHNINVSPRGDAGFDLDPHESGVIISRYNRDSVSEIISGEACYSSKTSDSS